MDNETKKMFEMLMNKLEIISEELVEYTINDNLLEKYFHYLNEKILKPINSVELLKNGSLLNFAPVSDG